MRNFLSYFANEVSKLRLNQNKTNAIFQLVEDSFAHAKLFNCRLMADNNGMNNIEVLNATTNFISSKLSEYKTNHKRKKKIEQNDLYVKPNEMAIGLRWDLVREHQKLAANLRLVQCKFQYISLIQSLSSLFKRNDFNTIYADYKKSSNSNVYSDFSSGNVFRSNELFTAFPNSIQIQIATDDFEVCNELGSKSTLHKICAFYFSIRNIPQKYRSKLNNIYLLLLCNSDDLKTKYTDMNDVLRPIVRELQFLEETGITLSNGLQLRGTLTNMSYDNLGGNSCLGLVECFRGAHFCKICECNQAECKKLNVEKESKIRNKHNYEQQLKTISESEKIDYSKTQGVKRYCALNDLKYFHTFENFSVDIMHDLNEGCIPFLMKHLLTFIIKSKMISEESLVHKFQFYDYGFLNQDRTPSAISLSKKNLNQNASQSKCLFQHVPFILYSEQQNEKIKEIWRCVESLLIITLISYSTEIAESDVILLEENVKLHLESIQKCFGVDLIPKHHFLTHYGRVIRQMGSLVPMSMMRYESKHKVLKQIAKSKHNFKNITKTIATIHQQEVTACSDSYTDIKTSGTKTPVLDVFIENNRDVLLEHFNLENILLEVKWFKYFDYNYRNDLFVFHNKKLYEIEKILVNENDFQFFLKEFRILSFIKCLNSVKVKQSITHECQVIRFKDLEHKQVYEKKVLNGEFYIIVESLETKRCLDIDF